jgi:hypothetical protein
MSLPMAARAASGPGSTPPEQSYLRGGMTVDDGDGVRTEYALAARPGSHSGRPASGSSTSSFAR